MAANKSKSVTKVEAKAATPVVSERAARMKRLGVYELHRKGRFIVNTTDVDNLSERAYQKMEADRQTEPVPAQPVPVKPRYEAKPAQKPEAKAKPAPKKPANNSKKADSKSKK